MNLLDKHYTCHVYSMTTTHLKRNMMKTKKNKKNNDEQSSLFHAITAICGRDDSLSAPILRRSLL